MNQYRDLVNKLEAIQNRVDEGELDRMAAGGMDQLPPGYTRTPQGQIMAPNPAGQAQAAGNAQDQADMQRLSDYTFQQATKNSPKRLSPQQATAQQTRNDAVWEEGDGSNEPTMRPSDQLLVGEKSVEECGMPMSAPKQSDNVTMNVTAQGAGGIRDLMNLLRSMEQSSGDDHHPVLAKIGGMEEDQVDGGFGSATTNPSVAVAPVSAVTPTGNDLASKGGEAPKVNGGGNPMSEALLSRLANMYDEIKNEGYNPNSAAAENRRELESHRRKELEKKAAVGDEKAKKSLERDDDRKANMRAEYDRRMER
jgi:hypothetical protein